MQDTKNREGAFRFTYFTHQYQDTIQFYGETLKFKLEHSWDRSENDKGALFKSGRGLIEILKTPSDSALENAGLDYRSPQGSFMCIQVWEIDELFEIYKSRGVSFKQEITDQSWGHRSFSVSDPNGIVLFFFEERF